MAQPGDVVEAPIFGARAIFLETAEQTVGELLRVEVVLPPGFSVSEHVHPAQEERHRVVRGTLRARVGGQQRDYVEGETAIGPPGVPHAWSNPSDNADLCIVSEHRPVLHMEALLEGGFTIARDLQADKKGALKHLLRLAVLLDEARADFYMTQPAMQALLGLFTALAPVGRLLGYEPLHGEGRRGASITVVGGVAVGGGLLFLMLCMLWRRKRPHTS
jgi:quercetin dioxygenase-like cupin family protein